MVFFYVYFCIYSYLYAWEVLFFKYSKSVERLCKGKNSRQIMEMLVDNFYIFISVAGCNIFNMRMSGENFLWIYVRVMYILFIFISVELLFSNKYFVIFFFFTCIK